MAVVAVMVGQLRDKVVARVTMSLILRPFLEVVVEKTGRTSEADVAGRLSVVEVVDGSPVPAKRPVAVAVARRIHPIRVEMAATEL